jgi:hypothetical protein
VIHNVRMALLRGVTNIVLVTCPGIAIAAPITFSDAGTNAAAIQADVDAFRSVLGNPNNGNAPGLIVDGRREINWDGGGSTATSPGPNPFTVFHESRGAFITSPTSGATFVQVPNADLDTFFGNSSYNESRFPTFSPNRLFSGVGSNITDVTFSLPGSPATPAFVSGFGVVFSDVDVVGSTTLQFFDVNGNSLGSPFSAPAFNNGLSFLGVVFDAGENVGRVRITSGNVAPGPNDTRSTDVVMMDDFLYSEPQVVPEPATSLLFSTGLAMIGVVVARKRRKSV